MKPLKISIIGGGIGGLMTAIALNKKGIPATIYEKNSGFDVNGAGLALWPNATRILDQFGLLNTLQSAGSILTNMKAVTADGRHLNTVRLKKLEDQFHFPSLVLLRSALQKALLNAIPAEQIHYNKQFTHIQHTGDETIIHFSDGATVTSDAVIFADGVYSKARKMIFDLPDLLYAGRTSWRGIAQFDKPIFEPDTSYEIFGKGRRIGIFPLPNNLAYWYAAVNMPETETSKQQRSIEGVLSHFPDWAEPVNTLFKNTPEDRLILTNIQYTPDIHKLAHKNLALLGDAAHPMTPDLGQGACQAIEDAFTIASCFTEQSSVAESLQQYENLRLKRVKSIAKNSFRLGAMRQMEHPVGLAIRNTLFKILPERFALSMLARNIRR